MSKMHVKTGDTVVLLTGHKNNKVTKSGAHVTGKVLEVAPKEGKVIVEGFNTVTKHVKPKKQGDEGGIVKVDSPLYACKVQLYCPKCDKGVRTHTQLTDDGKKVRVCAKCGYKFD